jgi:hypothetical protein
MCTLAYCSKVELCTSPPQGCAILTLSDKCEVHLLLKVWVMASSKHTPYCGSECRSCGQHSCFVFQMPHIQISLEIGSPDWGFSYSFSLPTSADTKIML